jgi:DNA repair ATPase RecN
VRSAIEDCTAKLDRVEATLDRVEATRRDLRAAAEQAEALSTEVAQAKRMFAAELAALEMGRQLLDKLSERIAALR